MATAPARYVPGRGWFHVNRVSVVIASGKRPVTFRTRKLRLTAPMVLRGGPRGRVGHRRTTFIERGCSDEADQDGRLV